MTGRELTIVMKKSEFTEAQVVCWLSPKTGRLDEVKKAFVSAYDDADCEASFNAYDVANSWAIEHLNESALRSQFASWRR